MSGRKPAVAPAVVIYVVLRFKERIVQTENGDKSK